MTQPVAAHPFEFSGGARCLDFVNTLGDRPVCANDRLAGYADLLRWATAAGILTSAEARKSARAAAGRPADARRVFEEAIVLRESLYSIFSALAAGKRAPAEGLAALNAALESALSFLHLESSGARTFRWGWAGPPDRLDRLLWPVARSAAELLVAEEADRVRECASECCSWLFLDRSPTCRRRWCDMKTCGNRAKARRHYARKQQQRAGGDGL